MKRKTIVGIAIICFMVIGCKSKIAMNYNDMVVEKQKILRKKYGPGGATIKKLFSSYQYDSIASVSSRMETKLTRSLRKLRKNLRPL